MSINCSNCFGFEYISYTYPKKEIQVINDAVVNSSIFGICNNISGLRFPQTNKKKKKQIVLVLQNGLLCTPYFLRTKK